jgi:predicted PurR-regulated permease PerM
MPVELTERQRRLLDAVLALAVVALGFVVLGDVAGVLAYFLDILFLFFLAWLLAFAILPLIHLVKRLLPGIPDLAAVIVVYLAIVGLLLGVIIQASASLATSIGQFIQDAPRLEDELGSILTDLQHRLGALGFHVDLVSQAPTIVQGLQSWATQLVGPLQQVAVASVSVLGNVLLVVILSVYIAIDRDDALAFVYRLVPPGQTSTARLVQASVARSFGGFLRTQLIMGIAFGIWTAGVNVAFGLPYGAVTTAAAGLLHMIPFFGPFVSWLPPVAVALLASPGTALLVLIAMAAGWFVTMNVLQPRLMAGAVGIHPIVVLGSVIVGAKLAGIGGAIFGIPIAAVLSAFFFHWFERSREGGSVADRATKRLEAREGRRVRRPMEPVPGVDEDLEDAKPGHHAPVAPVGTTPPAPADPAGAVGEAPATQAPAAAETQAPAARPGT